MSKNLVIPGGETIDRYLEANKGVPEDIHLIQSNLINNQYEVTEIELFLTNSAACLIDALYDWLYENRQGIASGFTTLERISVRVNARAFKYTYLQIGDLADLLSKIPIQRFPGNRNLVYLDVVFVRMDNETHELLPMSKKITIPITFTSEQSVKESLIAFFVYFYNISPQIERTFKVGNTGFLFPSRF